MSNRSFRRAALALGGALAVCAPAPTQRPATSALAGIEPGLWQLRDIGRPGAPPARLCLGSPYRLVQLRHPHRRCARSIVGQREDGVTVHYTCGAGEYGQTFLRIETPRLVQIDAQGIADGRPFALRAEARKIGRCGGERGRR